MPTTDLRSSAMPLADFLMSAAVAALLVKIGKRHGATP